MANNMESIKPPDKLCTAKGSSDQSGWKSFIQHFRLYLLATDRDDKPDVKKVALLLSVAGEEAISVYNTFTYAAGENKDDFELVVKKFDEYFAPAKNEVFERYIFRTRTQNSDESCEKFITDLKLKAQTCNFADQKDNMIRDQIVFGVYDSRIREKLLRETKLTVETAVKICLAFEVTSQQLKTFSTSAKH